jgi:mono/diheme cytochrome c family protein
MTSRLPEFLALSLGFALLTGPLLAQTTASEVAKLLSKADIKRGETIYLQSCAACHGTNLEGQANWQTPGEDGVYPAPPHDKEGHTWHHPDQMLFTYIELGGAEYLSSQGVEGFKSGMDAYQDILSKQDIADILAYIKSTWPERERAIQASRSQP